jgi:hypothetical protein
MSNVEQAAHLYIVGVYIKGIFAAVVLGGLIIMGMVDYYRERRFVKEYEARKAARKAARTQKKSK